MLTSCVHTSISLFLLIVADFPAQWKTHQSLKKDEQSEGIPFIPQLFPALGQCSVTDKPDERGNCPAIDLCCNYLSSSLKYI